MLSSLLFQHSLRQSAACIESVQYSPDTQSFVTVDSLALRAWSSTKQFRAFHLEKDFKFIFLQYLHNYGVFLLIYFKPSSHCGFAELWTPDLNSVQKVKLDQKCHSNVHCALSSSQSLLIMTGCIFHFDYFSSQSDHKSNTYIYHLFIQKSIKPLSITWFPKGITIDQPPANERVEYIFNFRLIQQQIISNETTHSIQNISIVNDAMFFVAAERSMFVFVREKSVLASHAHAHANEQIDDEQNLDSCPPLEGYSLFKLIATYDSLFTNFGATVASLLIYQDHKRNAELKGKGEKRRSESTGESIGDNYDTVDLFLLAGYDNGSIGIFQMKNITIGDESSSFNQLPSLLLVFQAHSPDSNLPFSPLQMELAPWAIVPDDVYLLEFYSIGSDFKIAHWGLRKKTIEGIESTIDVDILGSLKFPLNSVEQARYSRQKKDHPKHLIKFSISPFSIQTFSPAQKFSRHCSNHGLMISFGGMLTVVMIQQPSKLLLSFQTSQRTMLLTSCGQITIPHLPALSQNKQLNDYYIDQDCLSLSSHETDSRDQKEKLFFLLSDGNITGHSMKSGKFLFQMTVLSPITQLNEQTFHSIKGKIVSLSCCEPCSLHYSEITGHAIVGYSDGTICLFTFELSGQINSKHFQPQSLIPTSTCRLDSKHPHNTPITFLKSIPIFDQNSHLQSAWLLVGDTAGNISIWEIPNKADPRCRDKLKCCTIVQGHLSGIVTIEVIPLSHSVPHSESQKILIGDSILISTSANEIKTWSWSGLSRELIYVGGIHHNGAQITAIRVVKLDSSTSSDPLLDEYNLLCLSGHMNGTISSRMFSTNPNRVRNEPITTIQTHTGGVLSIEPLDENYFSSTDQITKYFLSTSSDGSSCLLGVTNEGEILLLHSYFSPGPTHASFISSNEMDIEIFQINETTITSFIVTAPKNSIIPSRWRESPLSTSIIPELDLSESPRLTDGSSSAAIEPTEPTHLPNTADIQETPISMRKTSSSSSQPLTLTLPLDTALNPNEKIDSLPLSHRSFSTDLSIEQVNSLKIGHLSLKNLKHLTNREIWKADNYEFNSLHDDINDEDPFPQIPLASHEPPSELDKLTSWNITLGVRMELQNAKKDKTLLDYFRQNCIESKFPSEVITARDAAEILDRWVAGVIQNNTVGDTITKKQVLDIFSVLNVSENDILDFIKVAKLGAVLVTIHKNMVKTEPFIEQGLFSSKNRLKKKFSHMRVSNTLVTYNSMGERVIQKRTLQESTLRGIPDGYATLLRKIWNRSSARVPYHVNGVNIVSYDHCTLLKDIPLHIKKLLNKKVKLPRNWSSNLEHYFDVKRTVRISRTLLDMRQNYQQEFVLNGENNNPSLHNRMSPTVVPSMSEIMFKYFERNYGGGDMLIAHLKIVHFLEAICQYSDFSLLNTIRYFIFSEEDQHSSSIQKYIWLYVESRRWIFLHCNVITGTSVSGIQVPQSTTAIKVGSFLEPSLASSSSASALYLNWLLIQKNDSLRCLQEFLNIRGSYGPSVIENVQSVIIHALSPTSRLDQLEAMEISPPYADDFVDLEQFLEALIFETKKQDHLVAEIREQIFGSFALPRTTLISSQQMSDSDTQFSTPDQKSVNNAPDMVFQSHLSTLGKIQEMLQIFMATDSKRTGFTSTDSFQTVLMHCLQNPGHDTGEHSEQNYSEDLLRMKLTHECSIRYSSGEGSDSIGYIDFVALSMSWIFQQSEVVSSLQTAWMLDAVRSLRRGIDREQGRSLLLFLASAQAFPSSIDGFWMARDHQSNLLSAINGSHSITSKSLISFHTIDPTTSTLGQKENQNIKGISYEGQWNVRTALASDDPGLLTIQKLTSTTPAGVPGEHSLGVDGVEWKNLSKRSIDSLLFSNIFIPPTNRELKTIHGEVCKASHLSHLRLLHQQKPTPAPISSFELTDNIKLSPPAPHVSSNIHSHSQLIEGIKYDINESMKSTLLQSNDDSSSKRLKSVSLRLPLNKSEMDLNVEDSGRISTNVNSHLPQTYKDDTTPEIGNSLNQSNLQQSTSVSQFDSTQFHHIPASASLGTGYLSSSSRLLCHAANIYTESAEEESLKRSLNDFETMRRLEEELLKEMSDVNVETTLKIHEKYLAEKEKKKMMRLKEQESMRFKEDADEQRMKRKQQGLLMEEKARALEEADRIAKEEETRNKQLEIRAARAEQEALKREKELLEAEIHREMLELQSMRREERFSIAVEKAIAEKIAREERLKLEQLAREEAAREAERLRLVAEEDRRLKAEQEALKKAEIAAKKKERENELQEQANMSREDFDIPPEVVVVEPVPEEIVEEPEPIEVEKTPRVELSAARLKLYNIIKRLIAGKAGQKNHPRKNDNHHFFMPFNFAQDMRFDPFAANSHWEGPANLDDEDESLMPKTGYEDITKALHDKKVSLEKKKKNQLYHLNNPDIPSKDWTPMFRVDPIDWQGYFDKEIVQLKTQLDDITSRAKVHSQSTGIKATELTLKQESHPLSVKNFNNVTYITTTAASSPSHLQGKGEKHLIPLPFGKVVKDVLFPARDVFFQIEMTDITSILTVELTAAVGGSDLEMYLAFGYYPSSLKYDARSSKSISSESHTIVFRPASQLDLESEGLTTSFIVAVHMKSQSTTLEIPFSIWAIGSAAPHSSLEIDNVSSAIRAFNVLADYPKDELWKNMPKLHRLAQGDSLQSGLKQKQQHLLSQQSTNRSISSGASLSHRESPNEIEETFGRASLSSARSNSKNNNPDDNDEKEGGEEGEEDDDDLINMERFVSKSGRMKMRSDLMQMKKLATTTPTTTTTTTATTKPQEINHMSRLDKLMNPNYHRDLFVTKEVEDLTETMSLRDPPEETGPHNSSFNNKTHQLHEEFENKLKFALNPEKYFQSTTPQLPALTPTTATPASAHQKNKPESNRISSNQNYSLKDNYNAGDDVDEDRRGGGGRGGGGGDGDEEEGEGYFLNKTAFPFLRQSSPKYLKTEQQKNQMKSKSLKKFPNPKPIKYTLSK